jgi:hypothetical protein
MPDPRDHLPNPGVSKIGGKDKSSTLPNQIVPLSRRAKARAQTDVAQAAIDRGAKEIASPNPMTPGVKRNRVSILEVPLNIGSTEYGVCKWSSVDGETYRIRYGMPQGGRNPGIKLLPSAIDKLQWCTFREIVLKTPGAEAAMSIFSGMKMKMVDEDGKQLFPITIDMLRNARAGIPGVTSDATHDPNLRPVEEDLGYGIGVTEN